MDIEPKQPTRKGPAEWFTGDVYINGKGTEDGDGATRLEHVTDEQYKATAAPAAGVRPGRPIPPRRAGLLS